MFKNFKYAFFILSFMSFSSPSQASEENLVEKTFASLPVCAESDLVSWSLPMMQPREREARLEWFSRNDKLQYIHFFRKEFGLERCDQLLKKLNSWEDISVLSPTYTSYQPDAALNQKIAPLCPNLDIDRVYYRRAEEQKIFKQHHADEAARYPIMHRRFNPYIQSADFTKLTRVEKEAQSRVFAEAINHIEYYDLSQYLGEGIWAYTNAAAHVFRKDKASSKYNVKVDKKCFPMFETFQKVVNTNTCEVAYDPYQVETNLSNVTYASDVSGKYATARTSAFIVLDDTLYRLVLDDSAPLHRMRDTFNKVIDGIYLDELVLGDAGLEFRHLCSYSTVQILDKNKD